MITHIVAMGHNGAIGKDNKLLWNIPEDLKHFRNVTMGKTIVMGSNTFRSVVEYSKGKGILPGRNIIVISGTPKKVYELNEEIPQPDNIKYWTKAILDMHIKNNPSEEIYIVGGAQLYKTYKPSKLIITHVHDSDLAIKDADTFYPWDYQEYPCNSVETLMSKVGIEYSIAYYGEP